MALHKLHVEVCKARNLLNSDIGSLSDPYCIVKVGDEVWQTTVKKNNLNPLWNEKHTFTGNIGLYTSIALRMMDKDPTSADDFIGSGHVDLDPVVMQALQRGTLEKWVPLIMKDKLAGQVMLKLSADFIGLQNAAKPSAPPVAASAAHDPPPQVHAAPFTPPERATKDVQVTSPGTKPVFAASSSPSVPDTPLRLRSLSIEVVKAMDLINSDVGSLSDPYCIVKVGNEEWRTSVKKNDLNPVWNEKHTFFISIMRPASQVVLTMMDKDNTSRDDLLGNGSMDLDPVVIQALQRGELEKWIPLLFKNKLGGKVKLLLTADFVQNGLEHPPPVVSSGEGVPSPAEVHATPLARSPNPAPSPLQLPPPHGMYVESPISDKSPVQVSAKPDERPRSPACAAPSTSPYNAQASGRLCSLHVEVVRAVDLFNADNGSLSDPYCVVKVGHDRWKTKVKKDTLNPCWGEGHSFPISTSHPVDSIALKMMDKDAGFHDDVLGRGSVDLDGVTVQDLRKGQVEKWVALLRKDKPAGKVQLILNAEFE